MKLRFRLMTILATIGLAWLSAGCTTASRTRMMVDSMQPMMENMNKAFNKCNDVELARKAMPANLLQLAGFIEVSPDNPHLLLTAAEGYGGYAGLFLLDTDPERAARFYRKGRDYALRVLKQNEDFAQAFDKSNDKFNAALNTLTKEDAPALFFASTNWLFYCYVMYTKDLSVINDFPKVEAMLARMVELDETFKDGGIHAVLGCYNASRPDTMGGNPDASLMHFKKAFEISNSKFLLWQLYFAKYYAVQIHDKKLFIKTLQDILAAPDDLLPEKMLLNQAAKMKAEELLEKADALFATAS